MYLQEPNIIPVILALEMEEDQVLKTTLSYVASLRITWGQVSEKQKQAGRGSSALLVHAVASMCLRSQHTHRFRCLLVSTVRRSTLLGFFYKTLIMFVLKLAKQKNSLKKKKARALNTELSLQPQE